MMRDEGVKKGMLKSSTILRMLEKAMWAPNILEASIHI